MITSIRLKDFKNFADETLRLGPFTVIVGANASGKSNIRDAFRFLHGIGRGYTLADIVDERAGGPYRDGGSAEWGGIRGAPKEIARFGRPSFSITVKFGEANEAPMKYKIRVGVDHGSHRGLRVTKEYLVEPGYKPIYTSHPGEGDKVHEQGNDGRLLLRIARNARQKKIGHRIDVISDRPALTQIQKSKLVAAIFKDEAQAAVDLFSSMSFLDLTPERMRQPSVSGHVVLGESGENLPAVLQGICADESSKKNLIDWTRELTPMDVEDFQFPLDPSTGKIGLAIREANNRTISAYSASDGTLRFLAMLAALLGSDPACLYFFEEVDNGLHPSRLHLLVELIETQARERNIQVVATTHSPELLVMASEKTFENTSVVCRLPDTDDAIIRPLRQIPNAEKLRTSPGMGRLHAEGWMETMLAFASNGNREYAE